MEKVVNKSFIEDKEVVPYADYYATKIFLSKDGNTAYVTYYDSVVAVINEFHSDNCELTEECKK